MGGGRGGDCPGMWQLVCVLSALGGVLVDPTKYKGEATKSSRTPQLWWHEVTEEGVTSIPLRTHIWRN